MKITIIGAGWLGLPLLTELVRAGHSVWGSSRSDERLAAITEAGGRAFRVELPDNFFGAVFRERELLILTLPPGGRKIGPAAPQRYLERLAPLAPLVTGDDAAHVIYTSSTGVYGAAAGAVSEQTAVAPATHSARAVVAAERWLSERTDRLTIVRLAGLVGGDRHPGNFFAGRDVPQADAPVNLVHRDDVIAAIRLLIERGLPAGTFNVCAAAHPAKGDFYAAAAAQLGKRTGNNLPGGAEGKVISSERLRELGWRPQHDELRKWSVS